MLCVANGNRCLSTNWQNSYTWGNASIAAADKRDEILIIFSAPALMRIPEG